MDLTRAYHNLLGIEKTDGTQTFFWDFHVAVMEDERKKLHYYLQDDLGSPLRVLYGTGSGEVYGYDEFGRDLYEVEEGESMVILKTLAVNGAYGGMELSIEVTANLIDKLIEEILNWDWGNKE